MGQERLHESLARASLGSNNDVPFHALLQHFELIGADFEHLLPLVAAILGSQGIDFDMCHYKPVVRSTRLSMLAFLLKCSYEAVVVLGR